MFDLTKHIYFYMNLSVKTYYFLYANSLFVCIFAISNITFISYFNRNFNIELL